MLLGPGEKGIQEGNLTIFLSEMDVWAQWVDVLEELMTILEEEVGVLKQISSRAMISEIDIDTIFSILVSMFLLPRQVPIYPIFSILAPVYIKHKLVPSMLSKCFSKYNIFP